MINEQQKKHSNKTDILFVLSQLNASPLIELAVLDLKQRGYSVACCFVLDRESILEKQLLRAGVRCARVHYSGRMDAIHAFLEIMSLIRHTRPKIVHTHLLWASILGLAAAFISGVKIRVMTRHHADMHHLYKRRGVLYDKFCNYLATKIVAPSVNIEKTLMDLEGVPEQKVEMIEHGYDFRSFENVPEHDIDQLKKKYQLSKESPVIGVVARLTHWKGVQDIIPAFKKILIRYPDACLLIANAVGDYREAIEHSLNSVPKHNYRLIEYETDIAALYRLFDVFVHAPISAEVEGFGQVYLEALMSCRPSVFTLSGVANKFIKHKQNAYVVDYNNPDQIYEGIHYCLENPDAAKSMASSAQTYIRNEYDYRKKVDRLDAMYREQLQYENKHELMYVLSQVQASPVIELTILGLRDRGLDPVCCFLAHKKSVLEKNLEEAGIECVRIPYCGRTDAPYALWCLIVAIKKYRPRIVHAHLLWAGIIGFSASLICGVKSRIITRHYSDMHHLYYPKGVWYDRYCNMFASKIVVPCNNIREVLINKESVSDSKIKIIEYGFDFETFENVSNESILRMQEIYNPQKRFPVVGVVSRFTFWKGVQNIIPAFKKLLDQYPNALLVLANADGDYKDEIRRLLADLPEASYVCIPFEKDIPALYRIFDLFVHVPVTKEVEGFGQVYLEALASGVPCVFTLSGIANDFISHMKNAYVVDHENSDQIYQGMTYCLKNSDKSRQMSYTGYREMRAKFNDEAKIDEHYSMYCSLIAKAHTHQLKQNA